LFLHNLKVHRRIQKKSQPLHPIPRQFEPIHNTAMTVLYTGEENDAGVGVGEDF